MPSSKKTTSSKKITPTNPATTSEPSTDEAKTADAERKTASIGGRFRKTASGNCRF